VTISHTDLTVAAHRRARENQPRIRRRVNSSLSSLFGTGMVATLAMALLDAAPWWVLLTVGCILAVGEVLAQAFSKGPLTPSQEDTLAAEVAAMEAEANPEPSPLEVRVAELAGAVESVTRTVDRLAEQHDLEAQATAAAARPDPVEAMRAEAEATLGGR
jgi:hypothetical protein